MLKRIIPSSGEELPVIGMGTWQKFDVRNKLSYPTLREVLTRLHLAGGTLIDSSPMYGSAEKVIGDLTSEMPAANNFFYATKVWTSGLQQGIRQLEQSMKKMLRPTTDLVQVHNLLDWRTHIAQLKKMKEMGKIRYIGITHYADSSHDELENVMRQEVIDFVQFNYSIFSRHAEKRLLDAAADRGVATLINLPFGSGRHFEKVKHKALPSWAKELEIESWSSYFLKFIIAHPGVTCVIPATGNSDHMTDNLKAGSGILPGPTERNKMVELVAGF
jgi:diketogulonate reductase-like aldo/keto reductase